MQLNGTKVAILATNGFEQSELIQPRKALDEAGATTHIVSPESGHIKGWHKDDWGDKVAVDRTLADASPADYDALVLPGGVINPDLLRVNDQALSFIRHFFQTDKPVGVICHGCQTMITAGLVEGRTMTAYKAIKQDVINAGANWKDDSAVVDGNLVSSRKPDDLPDFCDTLVEVIARVDAAV